ncbi:hypothetical protein BSZ19_14230 [Bradyrhizobium japonicum]|uniref:Uncharacterized protein n=1 Tax=Bradyrhizobium japonicum TaxID=375 RepID=A0A1Y2JQU6_BRAJP|nr:hypothetical protein BSZ19_14230 [Bradyrhizobium japonicum]
MSGVAKLHDGWKRKSIVRLSVGLGLTMLAAANAQLLYVAMSSQPDCVGHLRLGEGGRAKRFSAATSSCLSRPSTRAKAEME